MGVRMSPKEIEVCDYVRELCGELAKMCDDLNLTVLARLFRMTEMEAHVLLLRAERRAPPEKRRLRPVPTKKARKLAA